MSQSPPSPDGDATRTRTEDLVREGGLCIVSSDFNRQRFINEASSHYYVDSYPVGGASP